jgi:multidrug efflux system outer membrane protein
MRRFFTISLISLAGIALCSCATSVKQKAIETLDVPKNWQSKPNSEYSDKNETRTKNLTGAFTNASWLDYFENNTQLQSLIQEGILSNKDLAIASARVDKAQAELRTVQPNRLPTIDINGQGRRQKFNDATAATLSGVARSDDYTANLGLRWEIDLWGSLRNQVQFSRSQLESSQANLKYAQMSIASQIAKTWLSIMHIEGQISLLEEHQTLQNLYLKSIEERYRRGLIFAEQFLYESNKTQAIYESLNELYNERDQLHRSLAVLMGEYPKAEALEYQPLPDLLDPIPAGIPSDLLLNRPDLIAMERQLAGSRVLLKSAKKQRLPKISLTGAMGNASPELNNLINSSNAFWNVGVNLSQPLINYGRINANIRASKAQLAEAEATYEKVILNAFMEVENTLSNDSYLQTIRNSNTQVLNQAEEIASMNQTKYIEGNGAFLYYLSAKIASLQSQREHLQINYNQLKNRINLYLALGYSFI